MRLRRRIGVLFALAACASSACDARSAQTNVDWPLWGNGAANTHYADLSQVNTTTVTRLRIAWTRSEGPEQFAWETFPVVVGTTMYYSTDTGGVVAVDAASGRLRWSYLPSVDFFADPATAAAAPVSRGVTVAHGVVYDVTADDQLIALDARSGRRRWDVRVADASAGYTEDSPVTYWNGELLLGGPAGDGRLRGFVAAFDAQTGRALWRTSTVPESAERSGGDVWMAPVVGDRTGTVYVATGNPTPAFDDARRHGCDRWSDATIALNARSGALLWGHSELCDDTWDYDTDQSPELFDVERDGRTVAAVGDASKAGFYSILDAHTGRLIARSAEITEYSHPHRVPRPGGAVVCPGTFGGIEYGPSAYSPRTADVYVDGSNLCMRYRLAPRSPRTADLDGSATAAGPSSGVLAAVNTRSGRTEWRVALAKPAVGGTLATAGNLVFTGDDDGSFSAVDALSGRLLWRTNVHLRFGSAPIAYEVAGVEYIAVAAGGSSLDTKGSAPGGGRLFVFRLDRR
jgi:PQQ-dependent dehydrogenase (methanol/ethanol family)